MGGCCGAMKTGQKSLPEKKKSPSADANLEKSNGKESLVAAESIPATGTGKTPPRAKESTQQDGLKDAAVKPTLESVVTPEKVSLDAAEPVRGKEEADTGEEHVMDLETAVAPYEGVISNEQPPPKGKVDSADPELLIPYQIPTQNAFSTPAATTTADTTANAANVKYQEFQLRVDEPQLEANSQDYAVQLSIIENDPICSVNDGELPSSSPADEVEAVPPTTEPSTIEATPTVPHPRAFANVELDDGENGDTNTEELVTAIKNYSFSPEAQGGLDEIASSVDQRQGDLRQELTVDADVSLPASSVSELDAIVASEQGLESHPTPCQFDTHFTLVHPPEPSVGFSGSDHQLPDDLELMATTELTYNEHETPVPGEESTSDSFGGEQVTPVEFQLDKELLEEPVTLVQTQRQELTPTDEHDLQQPNVADLETAPEPVNLVPAASEPDPQTEASEETKQPDQPQADEQILTNDPFEVPWKPELHHDETEPEFSATVEETLSSDNLPTPVPVPQGEADDSPVAVPAQEVEFEPGTLSKDFQQETAQAESALESHPVVEVSTDLPMTSVLVDDSAKEKNGADDDNGAVSSFHLDESLATASNSLQTEHAEEFPSHLELTQAPLSEFEQQLSEPASHYEPIITNDSVDGLHASVPETSGEIQTSETVEKLEEQLPHHEPSADFVEVHASVAESSDVFEPSETVDTPEVLASYQGPDERQTPVGEISGEIQTSETVQKFEEHVSHQEPPAAEFIDEVHTSVTDVSDASQHSDTVEKFEQPVSNYEPSATALIDGHSSIPERSGEIQTSETAKKLEEQVSHQEPSAAEFIDEVQESVPETSDEIQPSETVEKFEEPVLHQEQSKTDYVDEAQAAVTEASETAKELEEHHEPSTTEFIDEFQSSGDILSQEIVEKLEEQVSLHEPSITDFIDEVPTSVTEASGIEHSETVEKIEGLVPHQDSPTTDFSDEAPTIVTEASDIVEHSETVEKFEAPVLHHEPSTKESIDKVQSSVSEPSGEIQPSETETVEKLEEQAEHDEPSKTEFIDEVHTSVADVSDASQHSDTVEKFEEPPSNYEPSATAFIDGHSSVPETSGEIQTSETAQKLEEQVSHQEPSAAEFIDEVQESVPETSDEIQPSETVEKFEGLVLHQEQSKTEFVDDAPASVAEAPDVIEHSDTAEKFEEPVSHNEPTTKEFIDEVQSSVPETLGEIQNQETVEKLEEPLPHHEPSTTEFIDEIHASSVPETSDVIEQSETIEKLEETVSHHEPSTTEFIDELQASAPETCNELHPSETVEKLEDTGSHHEPSTTEFIGEIQASSVPEASGEIQTSETLEASTVLEVISEQTRESRETWWKEGGQSAADSDLPVLELVTDQAQQSRQTWWEQSDPESVAENADSASLPLSSESVTPSIDQREEVPPESCSPHQDELSPIPPTDDDDDKAAVPLPIPTDDAASPSPVDDPFPEVIPDPLPSVFDSIRETVPDGGEKTPPDSAVESPLSADGGEGEGGGSAVPTAESGDDAMTPSSDGAYASSASPEDSTPSSAALTPGDVVDDDHPPAATAEAAKEPISAQA